MASQTDAWHIFFLEHTVSQSADQYFQTHENTVGQNDAESHGAVQRMLENHPKSGNLQTLLQLFCTRLHVCLMFLSSEVLRPTHVSKYHSVPLNSMLTCLALVQNFCVILSQHSPTLDHSAYFLVTLKRPEQRQLDQQRKVCFL